MTQALVASQLIRDMDLFSNGLDTVIGERGINISGGQRARISLARAVYSEADIYLLDDPLSAVDPQVASDIFEKCIRGVLKDKLVVLVTHQLQFLKNCEKILVIKDKKQMVCGDYETITQKGFDIEQILQSYNKMIKGKDQQQNFKSELPSPVKTKEKEDPKEKKTDEKKTPGGGEDLLVQEEKETG